MSNKPSVLFFTAWWPRKEHPFEGLFVREHANAIAEHYDLHIVQLNIAKGKPKFLYSIDCETTANEQYSTTLITISTRIRRFGLHDFLIKKAFARVIKDIRSKHKIIGYHFNIRTHITRHIPYLPCLSDLNFVHTEHFSYYHRGLYLLPEKEKQTEISRLEQWFANKKLAYFTPVSRDLENIICNNFGLSKSKVAVIENLANSVFKFEPTANKPDKLSIILVAQWTKPKNPVLFFEAVLKLPKPILNRLEITIIGDGELLTDCKKLVQKGNIGHLVSFLGFLPKAEIQGYFRQSAFFVHPTDRENLPTVIIEALCSGLPVLSMRVNGIPELVNESNGLLVEPQNAEALAAAIEKMIEIHHNFDRMSISANAISKYSSDSIGKKFKTVYEQSFY